MQTKKKLNEEMPFPFPPSGMPGESRITSNFVSYGFHTIRLDEEIAEPSQYREEFELIENAGEGDVIRLVINSPGGRMDTALQFIQLLRNSRAETVACLMGETHSAASMIALACRNWEVSPFASMMVHNAFYGTVGTASSVQSHVDFSNKHLLFCMKDIYSGFLRPIEIKEVMKGEDKWFTNSEIEERLKKYADHRDKTQAKANQLEEVPQN